MEYRQTRPHLNTNSRLINYTTHSHTTKPGLPFRLNGSLLYFSIDVFPVLICRRFYLGALSTLGNSVSDERMFLYLLQILWIKRPWLRVNLICINIVACIGYSNSLVLATCHKLLFDTILAHYTQTFVPRAHALSHTSTCKTSVQVYFYSQHILQCDIRNIIN